MAIGALFLAGAPATAQHKAAGEDLGTLASEVVGSFTDSTGGTGTLTGAFNPTEFKNTPDGIVALGTLTGDMTDSTGTKVGSVSEPVTLPLDTATSSKSCQILDLVIRPIDLNLLGLKVHLSKVHLNITAKPGQGNLLGNLLCAVAGLLDSHRNAEAATTLNTVLGLVGRS
ncbi:hypothetical protein D5S17_07795 [Pseudonocardiaceae bacterium YIM PH 21723]|nr:hypothetical protein D5S17_07795 [Pseudonocardiaceae bacterium YIM PH 21723]